MEGGTRVVGKGTVIAGSSGVGAEDRQAMPASARMVSPISNLKPDLFII
jgi:hypothetical protein